MNAAGNQASAALAPSETQTGQIALRALSLFRDGKDTLRIAKILKVTESRASTLVWLGRCIVDRAEPLYLNRTGDIRRVVL